MKRAEEKYIGYQPADYQTPYAKYFQPTATPSPSAAIAKALQAGSLPAGAIPALSQAATMLQAGYADVECGYTLEADGSARLAILTPMPRVTPLMWHWWFGWHGDQDNKYKLWHPPAHVSAVWADGVMGNVAYIDRVSHIHEYIGKTLEKAAIQFVAPATLGLPDASTKQVFICARIGFIDLPLDYGWLVHQVRKVSDGAEMRSRFWIGGEQIKFRADNPLSDFASGVVQRVRKVSQQQVSDLVNHCSEEMRHLAIFLPALYTEFQGA
jgi:hypothetical protein